MWCVLIYVCCIGLDALFFTSSPLAIRVGEVVVLGRHSCDPFSAIGLSIALSRNHSLINSQSIPLHHPQTGSASPKSPRLSTTKPNPPGTKSSPTAAWKKTPKSSSACAIKTTSATKRASALLASLRAPGPNQASPKSSAPAPRPAPLSQALLARAVSRLPYTMVLPCLPPS